ncbi:MAG: riboflavin synthase [Verrucomicrobiota bacterium]
MFTGIVERTALITDLKPVETGAQLQLDLGDIEGELELGESVAVNGCCLTVATFENDGVVSFDLLAETLRLTNLGSLTKGSVVNIERALLATARLSGHFVQGHVDACAKLLELNKIGQDHELVIELPSQFSQYTILKGSICVDGMSLTIAELHEDWFKIWITPHTFKVTNLQNRKVGELINLEFDVLAKYLEKLGAVRETD